MKLTLQDALIAKGLTTNTLEVERFHKEYVSLYNKYVGDGFYCQLDKLPKIVYQARIKWLNAANQSD